MTATLSGASSAAVTVTVSASAVSPAVAGDFTISTNKELSIAAGSTSSTGTVTITAVDNSVDAPNKTVTVSGAASGGGVSNPSNQTLTITDDDGAPTVTLVLSPSSISENGGSSTVTATLSGASSAAVTVTVSASAVSPAVAGDFTISTNKELTIAAGSTSSTGTVTITAVNNSVDAPNKTVTVSGAASGGGVSNPSNQTLTITDDDGAPTVTLVLSPSSISENGGSSTVTATLSGASSAAVTVTVSASAVSPAVAGDFTISTNKELTIAAGSTSSTGTVTITAVNNSVDAPDKEVTVSGTASGGGVSNPSNQTLTITDDDGAPTVTLVLTPSSISENGELSTVTATLSGASSAAVTVTVSASAVSPAVAGDFTISTNKELSIAAGSTSSTGTVTITAVNNSVDAPNKTVTVSGAASGGGVSDPSNQTLTITDDDGAPTVTLALTPSSISENGGSSTVTATLSGASSAAVTVTVSASAVSPAVAGDFTISTNKELTIAAGSTSSTGTVTITAVDNSVDAPNKTVTVSGTASGGGVSDPSNQTLTITDDDGTIALSVTPASVAEDNGTTTATVTATWPGTARRADTAITVKVGDSADAATEGTDYTTVDDLTLTIAAGATSGVATFSIEPIDDAINEGDESLSISGITSASGLSVTGTQMTITDNDATPTVTPTSVTLTLSIPNPTADLELNPMSVSENDGVAVITATLSNALTSALTIEISATPVSPATEDDYVLSDNTTLTVEAGSTDSTGVVNLTAVDNMVDSADKEVTISGTVNSDSGISDPLDQTLTIIDDDTRGVVLSKDEMTVTEAPGNRHSQSYKVSLATQPTDTVRVDLAADDDQMVTVEPQFLIFGTSDWREQRTVVVTGVDNDSVADDPTQRVMLYHTASGGDYGSIMEPAMVMVMDDDMPASENRVDLQPWLARFGRTVTDQALELVTARLNRSPAPGEDVILAGQSLKQWTPDSDVSSSVYDAANSYQSGEDSSTDFHAMETAAETDNFGHLGNRRDHAQTRTLSEKDLLAESSFSLTMALDNTGHNFASLWGEGVVTSFEGEAGGIRLDGKVSSGYVGFDFATYGKTTGLSLGHSRGKGTYSDTDCDDQNCDGSIVASLTGVYPYGKFQVTDRMSLWAAAGIGDGEVTIEGSDGEVSRTNLSYAMAAIGMRNEITDAGADDGFSLAWKADARFTRTTSGRAGSLAGTAAEVSLLRFGLEGSHSIEFGKDAMVLTPSFQLIARYDGGDAEKGLGAELQGGLSIVDQKKGLSFDIAARGLIAHKSKGFREKSVSAALAWDPNSASDEGVSLSLKHSWSSMPSGGQALNSTLWENSIGGLSASDSENVSKSTQLIRTSLEMGYGMSAFNGRFIATPNFAIESSSDRSRNLRLGWKLSSAKHSDSVFTLSADITRDISAGNLKPEHGFKLSAELRF